MTRREPLQGPMGAKFDKRRLTTAALGGIAGGGSIGLLLGLVVGLPGDLSGVIAGAVCVALVELIYARAQRQNRR